MNMLRNMMSLMNIGRNQQRMFRQMGRALNGRRMNRGGMWLSLAALAIGSAAYGMRRREINRGMMRAGQAMLDRFNKRNEPTPNRG